MRVRLLVELRNGFVILPVGKEMTVMSSSQWHRLELSGEDCECCGVRPRMTRVHWRDVEPVG